jgi:hypothetical protein
LNRQHLNGDWFTDTQFSKVSSIQGAKCAEIFTNGNFTTVHPLNSKARVAQALSGFTDNVGIPDTQLSDGAVEVTGQHTDLFMKEVKRLKIRLIRSKAAGRSIRIMPPNGKSASSRSGGGTACLRAKCIPKNCGTMVCFTNPTT